MAYGLKLYYDQPMLWQISKLLTDNTKWLEQKQNTILSAAMIITVSNILSSLSGLVRERLLIGYFFGSSTSQLEYEALQVAFQIPDLLFQLIVLGAVSAAFIPVFTSLKKHDEEMAFSVSSSVMTLTLIVFLFFSILAFIFAPELTHLRTGVNFTEEQLTVAVALTRIMLVAQLFFAISNFLTGILQSYQRFIMPAIAPVLYNIGIVLGVALFHQQIGIYSAGVGVVMGALMHMVVQWPLASKLGFKFRLAFNFRDHSVKEIISLMPPRLLTVGMTELQTLGLTFFATTIGNLSFAIIRLALRLMAIPIRLFGVPISQASLPFLSEESADRDRTKLNELIVQSLHQIAFFALPASVLLLILRVPIVRLVFGAENFPWKTTLMTGRVVAIIALSIAAQAMTHLLVRVFHAMKDTKTPFFVTVFSVLMYLGTSAVTVYFTDFGVMGLAVATSVSALIELFLFMWLLNRRLNFFWQPEFIVPQLKMLAASFFMAVFLYLPFRILDELVFNTSRTLELIALTITTSTIGMMVYVYFSALFDIKELGYFTKLFTAFGKWRKPLSRSGEMLVDTSSSEI